tara:strand:- start:1220 stop:1438 length:219 start_codon:yes stop_codon:yes gene_type:complete
MMSLLRHFIAPLISGVLMIFVVFALKYWLLEVSLLNLIIQILLGGLVFSAALWLIDQSSINEIKQLVKSKRT